MRKRLAAMFLLLFSATASAKLMYFSMMDLAEQSDTVVAGTVMRADDQTAVVRVEKVLQGKVDGASITVKQFLRHFEMPATPLEAGERVYCLARAGQTAFSRLPAEGRAR